MTFEEAVGIINEPFFLRSDVDYYWKKETCEFIRDAYESHELIEKDKLIQRLKNAEQFNTPVPNWVWAVIVGA